MNIFIILCIEATIFNVISAIYIAIDDVINDGLILNNDVNGVACEYVFAGKGKGSSVSFQIEQFEVEDQVNLDNIKIPYAFFRYSDIAFYDNLPEVTDYQFKYRESLFSRKKLYDKIIDFDTSKFILQRNKISDGGLLPEPNIRTGYLDYRKDITEQHLTQFEINDSGVYCVFIAPPKDEGIKKLIIPVEFENSFGLSTREFIRYNYSKLSLYIGILIAGSLYLILKRSNGSIISHLIVYYVLFPLLLIQVMSLIPPFMKNNKYLSEISMLEIGYSLINWINNCVMIILTSYFPLLLSMGVGIIYDREDSRGPFSKLPKLLSKKANYMLYLHLTLSTIFSMNLSSMHYMNSVKSLFNGLGIITFAGKILGLLNKLMPFIWWSATIYYYFITNKSISKFPRFEEPGVSKSTAMAFRKSLLVINFTYILVDLLQMAILISGLFLMSKSDYGFLEKQFYNKKASSIAQILRQEKAPFFFTPYLEFIFCPEYIIILSLFWIWLDNTSVSTKSKKI